MRPSPRKIAASANESSGATPISTAVRAAPAWRTDCVNAICESPGTPAPIAAKTSVSRRPMWSPNAPDTRAIAVTTRKPVTAVTVAPISTCTPRESPCRIVDGEGTEERAGERAEEQSSHGAPA